MIKKSFFRTILITGLMVATVQTTFAQKTVDELKTEQDQLKTEWNSPNAQQRKEKLAKLQAPGEVKVESVDKLAVGSSKLLVSTTSFNETVPEMYKRTIGETIDGVTDVTVKKPTLDELIQLAAEIAGTISGANDAQNAVQKASDDVKSMNKLQAPKAMKSLNYSKDVLSLVLPELQLDAKVVANLIEDLKTSENL